MNETFNISRFGKYFAFDLKQMWHRNGKTSLMLGLCGLILYLAVVTISLVFSFHWQGPGIVPRAITFFLAYFVLVLYETRAYGHLTAKDDGSAYLMIPASALEKTVSMVIIGVFVLPLAFAAVYLSTDAVLALVDPSVGDPLATGIGTVLAKFNELIASTGEEMNVSLGKIWFPLVLQMILNLLFFLLCGLIFKKWKILGGFGIILALDLLVTNVVGLVFKTGDNAERFAGWVQNLGPQAVVDGSMVWASVVNGVVIIALLIAIYFRVKTLKH